MPADAITDRPSSMPLVLNEVTPGKRDTFGIYSGLIFYACENQYERITEVFIGDKVPSELVSKCGGN